VKKPKPGTPEFKRGLAEALIRENPRRVAAEGPLRDALWTWTQVVLDDHDNDRVRREIVRRVHRALSVLRPWIIDREKFDEFQKAASAARVKP